MASSRGRVFYKVVYGFLKRGARGFNSIYAAREWAERNIPGKKYTVVAYTL